MIFVDTGPILARYLERDQYHREAVEGWARVEAEGLRCVTSNHVLDETLTLLGRRAGYEFAAERARALLSSRALEIRRPGVELEWAAVELLARYADQRVSFTDCLSFALMGEARIQRAFTFDFRHFSLAGFEIWPGSL